MKIEFFEQVQGITLVFLAYVAILFGGLHLSRDGLNAEFWLFAAVSGYYVFCLGSILWKTKKYVGQLQAALARLGEKSVEKSGAGLKDKAAEAEKSDES